MKTKDTTKKHPTHYWYEGWKVKKGQGIIQVELPYAKSDIKLVSFETDVEDDYRTEWLLAYFEVAMQTLNGTLTDEFLEQAKKVGKK